MVEIFEILRIMKVSNLRVALVLLVTVSLLLSRHQAQAQHNATMYFMRELPLVNTLNPAFQPEAGSVYVGIPFFSSFYIDGGITARGVSINSLLSGQPKLRPIAENAGNYEGARANMELNLLNLGILMRDMYFTFNVTTKAHFDASVPGSLIHMAWYGNAPYLGEAVPLNGLGGKSMAFTEFAFGFSKEVVRDRITVGARLKYLMGHAYAEAYLGPNSYVYTDPESWDITVGLAPEVYFAGLPVDVPLGRFPYNDNKFNMGSYTPKLAAGHGASVELGFEIKGEQWTASGSLTNLGCIGWKSAKHVKADGGYSTHTFHGVNTNNSNMVQELKDSLINNVQLHGYNTKSLARWIDPTMTFAASYKLHEHFNAGALVAMNISSYNSYPMFALSLNTQKFPINGSLSYNFSNKYNNLGLGVLFGRRDLQFHVICDNLLAVNYRSARQANLRMGLNLLVGAPKNTAEQKPVWELLSPTKDEVKADRKAARKAAKEKKKEKPLGPLNAIFNPSSTKPVNKAPLNSAPQEAAPKRRSQGALNSAPQETAPKRRSTQGTLSKPAEQGSSKPKVKNKKPLN